MTNDEQMKLYREEYKRLGKGYKQSDEVAKIIEEDSMNGSGINPVFARIQHALHLKGECGGNICGDCFADDMNNGTGITRDEMKKLEDDFLQMTRSNPSGPCRLSGGCK